MRMLLLEDDWLLGDGVRTGLSLKGYAVNWVRDVAKAELALKLEPYDFLLLDLGLPDRDGLDFLRSLREKKRRLSVIILTARDTVEDCIRGLDCGADDYLVKPFDLEELAARIRALSRRSHGRRAPLLRHGGIVLDPSAHTVTLDGAPMDLSLREFTLLRLLLEQQNKILSRSCLENALYAWDEEVESNAVVVHIHNLRKKFGAGLVRTVRGRGYVVEERP